LSLIVSCHLANVAFWEGDKNNSSHPSVASADDDDSIEYWLMLRLFHPFVYALLFPLPPLLLLSTAANPLLLLSHRFCIIFVLKLNLVINVVYSQLLFRFYFVSCSSTVLLWYNKHKAHRLIPSAMADAACFFFFLVFLFLFQPTLRSTVLTGYWYREVVTVPSACCRCRHTLLL